MSTMYFLVCKKHKQYVYATDNKGNPPNHRPMREFLSDHDVSEKCEITCLNEYGLENLEYQSEYSYEGYYEDEETGEVYKE